MLLKRKIGPISWAIEAVVEAVLLGRGGDSLTRCHGSRNCGQFFFEMATIFATIGPRLRHDRAAIGPRSRRDRATIVVLVIRRPPFDQLEAIPPRKLLDRGSIAPRSRFDQTAIAEFFHKTSEPSDEVSGEWTVRSRSSGICF